MSTAAVNCVIDKYKAQDAGVDLVHYRQKLQPSKTTTDKVAAAIPISPLLRCVDSKRHWQFSIGPRIYDNPSVGAICRVIFASSIVGQSIHE